MSGGRSFFALDREEARTRVTELGGRPFHADVIRREAIDRGNLDYAKMSSLSRELRSRLATELPLYSAEEVARSRTSDGTQKLLLRFPDGAAVETVHMPSRRRGRGATLCVSSQVGCAVGCPFCASGKAGLVRNLTHDEIFEQFLLGQSLGPLGRSVVMGIGEPLLNYEALRRALETVRSEIGIGARKITVSTVGFPTRLNRIARDNPPFQLAISLHSPDDEQRARLVPAMAGIPIEEILAAGDNWFATTGREVTYEYVLLGGENDSENHAERLARRLQNRRATINLIPYNPIRDDEFVRPTADAANRFHDTLVRRGLVATVRWSRGAEADAACGQLRIQASP
jgi:23S rRNA (adenine2503-C2)-methyltransferase